MIEPQNLRITPALVALLTEIDEFKGRWKAVSWLSPDFLSKLQHSATIESVGSSTRIEGSRLMDHEVETVLQNLGTQSFQTRDEQEVAGYAKAMAMAFDAADILPATENHVLQLHSILLTFSEKDERHRGEYKKLDNHVAAFDAEGHQIGIVFETTTPFDTPAEMQRLTAWLMLRETQRDLHPLLVIGIYIVTFLKIHPFQDGNGRLSRVLTTLLLLRASYNYVPYLSLESIIEQNKSGYYRALRATQQSIGKSDETWSPWLEFFLTTLAKQTKSLGERIDVHQASHQKLTTSESQLLNWVESDGRLTVAIAVERSGESRNTIRKRLARLVEKGVLSLEGKGRGSAYRKR